MRILCGQLLAVRRGGAGAGEALADGADGALTDGAGEALADGADGALADTVVCLPRISRVAELQDKSGLLFLPLLFSKRRLDLAATELPECRIFKRFEKNLNLRMIVHYRSKTRKRFKN